MKKQIHLIAAARPNFMKIAPLYHALEKENWVEAVIVHTGQHYDLNMSDAFFGDLMLPEPHYHLGIGSGSHAEQTGNVMIAYEKLLHQTRPDLVVVVGDVNSTMACTLAATKVVYFSSPADGQPTTDNGPGRRPLVGHLEAGLRSFDRTMPEEINRIVTDSVADILWTPSPDGDENLRREGIAADKIERVGNIMIDSLEMMRSKIEKENTARKYGLENGRYGVVTLHRPSNVDNPGGLKRLCTVLSNISSNIPLIFPVHPRTRKNLERYNLLESLQRWKNLFLDEPIPYIQFMSLVFDSSLLITDSGGLQEESTYLGIPCFTLRPNTERPITILQGTNCLCSIATIEDTIEAVLERNPSAREAPQFWDGKTADRVVQSIRRRII